MSTTADVMTPISVPEDRRGSWVPNGAMIATRIMELRKRKGLMIALLVVNIGLPTIFLAIRLILHATDPKSYGPAGGYDVFTALAAGIMYVFGFIVAATLGASAGSSDLTEGMFRHLVVTGRSRLAIYFARIPAGLAIIVPMVAVGFTVVCAVCSFAGPTKLNYQGTTVPAGLSRSGLDTWAVQHYKTVLCDFPSRDVAVFPPSCGGRGGPHIVITKSNGNGSTPVVVKFTKAQLEAGALKVANQDFTDYSHTFLTPPIGLMVRTGLWIELEAAIGFIVALGLASLIGQRTVAVVLMIVLEVILTPIFSRHVIPHMINVQRGLVGLATAHLEPSALPQIFGGGNGPRSLAIVPESRGIAVFVIVAWLVGWTALGAWRMARRDA